MEDYLTNLDFGAALDYPELIHRATRLAADPEVRSALRAQYSWVFVDEFQDTDPRQSALLQAIAGDGRNLVVVGDPDQSVYAFRGAEVRNLLDFPDRFRDRGGKPAAVLPLGTTRRFGPHLLAASRRLARGIPTLGAVGADQLRDFRSPEPATGHAGDDRVEVRLFTSARAETDHVADLLRRAHLEEGLAWSDMAVLVRSGTASIPGLRRALLAAGVPVEVAGDEVPLVAEPSVAPLLAALQAVVDLDAVTVEQAHYLLTSPLGGLDAAELRSLGRQLRVQDRELATDERAPLPSGELVRRVLLRPGDLLDLPGRPGRTATRVEQLAGVLAAAAAQVARGATVERCSGRCGTAPGGRAG
jgi:superfamily I DNA/RNA helicase